MKHRMVARILNPDSYQRVRWKNGLGETLQLAISPPGAVAAQNEFDWRLSAARVETDADFSHYPGYDRVMIITEGAGLNLIELRSGLQKTLHKYEIFGFSGDEPQRGILVDGAVQDFNIFLRRHEVAASVELVTLKLGQEHVWKPAGETGYAYLLQGETVVCRQSGTLDAFTGATVDCEAGATVDCEAGATVDCEAGATVDCEAGASFTLSRLHLLEVSRRGSLVAVPQTTLMSELNQKTDSDSVLETDEILRLRATSEIAILIFVLITRSNSLAPVDFEKA